MSEMLDEYFRMVADMLLLTNSAAEDPESSAVTVDEKVELCQK